MSSQANQPLPEGFQLENYRILRLLAAGGFSFVYLAHDENETPVAVKEYLPATLALRKDAGPAPVIPEENLAAFRYGLKCFFEEGRALASLSHPNVVRVINFFRANVYGLTGNALRARAHAAVAPRVLFFYFGSSVYAYSLMLVLFLAGFGLGSAAIAPWVGRVRPLAALAWIEGGLALAAIASVPLFVGLDGSLTWLSEAIRPRAFGAGVLVEQLAALPILLPPTLLMGATLPAMARSVETTPKGLSWLGFFYAGNIAGAVAGSLLAGFYLLRVHDVAFATFVAVAINLAMAIASLGLSLRMTRAAPAVDSGSASFWEWM